MSGERFHFSQPEEAAIRECLEETGYPITVDRLVGIYEEISINNRFRLQYEQYTYKVYFIFVCNLISDAVGPVTEKDLDMIESGWASMEAVRNIPLCPQIIIKKLGLILTSANVLFLGAEHIV